MRRCGQQQESTCQCKRRRRRGSVLCREDPLRRNATHQYSCSGDSMIGMSLSAVHGVQKNWDTTEATEHNSHVDMKKGARMTGDGASPARGKWKYGGLWSSRKFRWPEQGMHMRRWQSQLPLELMEVARSPVGPVGVIPSGPQQARNLSHFQNWACWTPFFLRPPDRPDLTSKVEPSDHRALGSNKGFQFIS